MIFEKNQDLKDISMPIDGTEVWAWAVIFGVVVIVALAGYASEIRALCA